MEKKGQHLNHSWSQFSGECSFGRLVAVLCRNADILSLQFVHNILQIATGHPHHHLEENYWVRDLDRPQGQIKKEKWKFYHLAIWIEGPCSEPGTDRVNLSFGPVHLPVATDKELSTHLVSVRPSAIHTTTVIIIVKILPCTQDILMKENSRVDNCSSFASSYLNSEGYLVDIATVLIIQTSYKCLIHPNTI